jgi:hypothetical protein
LAPVALAVPAVLTDRYSAKQEDLVSNLSLTQSLPPVVAVVELQQPSAKLLQVELPEMALMQVVRSLLLILAEEAVAAETLQSAEMVRLLAGAPAAMVEQVRLRR